MSKFGRTLFNLPQVLIIRISFEKSVGVRVGKVKADFWLSAQNQIPVTSAELDLVLDPQAPYC